MSGRKYVSVDSSELASLRQDASRLRALRHDLPERIEAAVRQNQQELQRRLEPIEARQREFSRAVDHLSTEIRQVEREMAGRIEQNARQTRQAIQETNIRMENQRQELRHALNDTARRLEEADHKMRAELQQEITDSENRMRQLNQETRQLMRQQEQRLSQAITDERHQREQQVQSLQEEINAIHADRQRVAELAHSWLDAAQTVHDFIDGHYRHQQDAPGQLARMENAIQIARQNLDQNAPEAALGAAQSAYQDLSNLRLDLEKIDLERQMWREQALGQARQLLAEAQSNRTLTQVEMADEAAEVNYWTDGKLAALEDEINQTINRTKNEEKPLSIDDLRHLVEKTLPAFDRRLDDVIAEANLAVINSQVRINIADLAMQALEEQGFRLQDGATYEGEDMRGVFVAKAMNRDGTEVVISVVPDGDKNRLEVNSFEKRPRAPGELLQRSREIAKSMKQRNLDFQVSDPQELNEKPDESVRNLEEVRKRKPTLKNRQQTAAARSS